MEKILMEYYENNALKLHRTVDKIISKFGGISDKDMDDFYSLANEVFVDAIRRYNNLQSFDGFLYSCLQNKIKSEITKRNREKRKTDRMSISIDAPLNDDDSSTIGDTIASNFNIEEEVFGEKEDGYSKKMLLYLSKLSNVQKSVLSMSIAGYTANEIRKELKITKKQYADCNAAIHAYRNVSILF